MEKEDILDYGIGNLYGQRATINRVDNTDVNDYTGVLSHSSKSEFETPNNKDISIPETFKNVILKVCPEIKDVVSIGFRENAVYDPMTFNPIYHYLVGVDIYFDEINGMKKSKSEYGTLFTDYFKMTYNDVDYVTFHVQSFIFPPEKTNREKFLELFGTK
jgi:hypothetical protein